MCSECAVCVQSVQCVFTVQSVQCAFRVCTVQCVVYCTVYAGARGCVWLL